ncbi:hypothetical protein [Desulfatiferula olefinivorans]
MVEVMTTHGKGPGFTGGHGPGQHHLKTGSGYLGQQTDGRIARGGVADIEGQGGHAVFGALNRQGAGRCRGRIAAGVVGVDGGGEALDHIVRGQVEIQVKVT